MVMVCMPAARVVVLKEAVVTPARVLTFIGLAALLPSIWNWTDPVGVPPPGVVTEMIAVKDTLCPDTDGLMEEATIALVLALLTVWPPVKVPVLLANVL